MYKDKKITIYIPCRNESTNLEILAKRIPKFVDEVIVVSNNSSDNTYEKALELGLKAIKDDRTLGGIGYGYAHMSGIKEATGEIIISIDGDGQHPVEHLPEILEFFTSNDIDFLSCNRFPPKKDSYLNFKQWLGIKILNHTTSLLYGIKLNDILSGMWVMRKEIKDNLNLTEGDWNLSPQIKINAALNPNIKFAEFNIFQYSRMSGKTHQRHFRTGLNHLRWIILNRFRLFNQKSEFKAVV